MNEKKTLDDYEQIALDKYGIDSHAVKWVRAQKQNQGTLDMSEETMMKMLERMHKKTAAKQAAAQQTEQTPEVRDQEPVKSMFANLKKSSKGTVERREAVTQRIVAHLRTDTKERAIALLAGHMSITELEELAKFWDDRLSPEEKAAIAAAPDQA